GELDQAVAETDLGGAEALEEDRLGRAREVREAAGQLQALPLLHDDVDVGVRVAEEVVADVTSDNPGSSPDLRGRSCQGFEDGIVRRGGTCPALRGHRPDVGEARLAPTTGSSPIRPRRPGPPCRPAGRGGAWAGAPA